MSDQANTNRLALSVEEVARDTADNLLIDAIASVPGFVPPRVDNRPTEAILIAAHALIVKLDAMETSLRDASIGQVAMLDRMARALLNLRETDGNGAAIDAGLVPTSHERDVIYRALEADYLNGNTAATIESMDAALLRFKRLAGDDELVPTQREREVMYWSLLQEFCLCNPQERSIDVMEAVNRRFRRLVGIEV